MANSKAIPVPWVITVVLCTLIAGFLIGRSPLRPEGFTKKIFDPCSSSLKIGTVCSGGTLFAGKLNANKYMTTPSGCTNVQQPVCAGGGDKGQFKWYRNHYYLFLDAGKPSDGAVNTNKIMAGVGFTAGDEYHPSPVKVVFNGQDFEAAAFCSNMTFGGYDDWFLPSQDELTMLYDHQNFLGGFMQYWYWSSTELDERYAWARHFGEGQPLTRLDKFYNDLPVRCVRKY